MSEEDARRFGRQAEAKAERYLKQQGYTILHRNLRFRSGELDLVIEGNGALVFVEVKARWSEAYGGARAAITRAKPGQLVRLASQYLAQVSKVYDRYRFDVILCPLGRGSSLHLEHIENAFEVPVDE